jgi:hypothetical protein
MVRIIQALTALLLLSSCLLTPGKFVSTLDIKRDRSFTFTYVGEAVVMKDQTAKEECEPGKNCDAASVAAAKAKTLAEDEAKLKAIGAALAKESGYRSVQYVGERKFRVDYQISGKLDRAFLYPFNSDGAALYPWIAVELRQDGTARVKAPGFGDEGSAMGPVTGTPLDEAQQREGTFTLTTDAEIVMQNEEGGAQPSAGGTKTMVWHVTPTSHAVPTAILRFAN